MKVKWFDDILLVVDPHAETTEISISDLLGGGNGLDATIVNDGNTVGEISSDMITDPNTLDFSMRYRLKIAAEHWENTEVVCEGNALDITIGTAGENRYKVTRTVRAFRPAAFVEETEWELTEFNTTKEFVNYVNNLDNDGVEILRQIYYDRWCFDSSSQKDRRYYDILEEEKKERE